jgi:hypothetical protein
LQRPAHSPYPALKPFQSVARRVRLPNAKDGRHG